MSDQHPYDPEPDETALAPELARLHGRLLREGERWRQSEPSTARLERHVEALARSGAAHHRNGHESMHDREDMMLAERNPVNQLPAANEARFQRRARSRWRGLLPAAAAVLLVALAGSIFAWFGAHHAGPGRAMTRSATPAITHVVAVRPQNTQLPLPANAALADISFSSAHDGWAVGSTVTIPWADDHTLLIHYHDGVWTASSDTIPDAYLSSVAMVSEDEGWAVGNTDGSQVDGSGAVAILLHYTGGHWQRVDLPALAGTSLWQIHMRSATFGYITGKQDTTDLNSPGEALLLMYQNGAWIPFPKSFHTYAAADGVMVSPDEGWFMSPAVPPVSLYHYDNGTWTKTESIPGLGEAVTAVAPNDIWSAGVTCNDAAVCQPAISHYNGVSWAPVAGPQTPGFAEIDFPFVRFAADVGGHAWYAVNTNDNGQSGPVDVHIAHDHTALYAYTHGVWTAQTLSVPGEITAMTTDGNGGTWAIVEADAAPALPLGINILYTTGNGWSIYGQS